MAPSSQPPDIVTSVTTPENGATLDPLEDLLDVLDLRPAGSAHVTIGGPADDQNADLGESERDIFIGRSQPMPHGRVFGGQVLAQSVVAAGRTVTTSKARHAGFTRCMATSCALATPATRFASPWSACATGTPSRLVGSTRSSSAGPSCR